MKDKHRGCTDAMNSDDIVAISENMMHDHVLGVDLGSGSLLV
jgi:hypothetical protein